MSQQIMVPAYAYIASMSHKGVLNIGSPSTVRRRRRLKQRTRILQMDVSGREFVGLLQEDHPNRPTK